MSRTAKSRPGQSNPAVLRCAKAWERAYRKVLAAPPNLDMAPDGLEALAREQAGTAFRNALPPLSGEDNIRNFIASVAYALVREILPPIVCTGYLHAAKIALAAVRASRRQPRSAPGLRSPIPHAFPLDPSLAFASIPPLPRSARTERPPSSPAPQPPSVHPPPKDHPNPQKSAATAQQNAEQTPTAPA